MNVESLCTALEAIRDFDPTRRSEYREQEPSTADLLSFARVLADAADRVSLRHYREANEPLEKADGSFITIADTSIETLLRAAIAERFPSHAVLGEGEGAAGSPESNAQVRWVIDPMDGTHNYMRGIPVWATLIACERAGTVEVGLVSAPALGTRWWAARGLGAHRSTIGNSRGGERIHVSQRKAIAEATILVGSYRDLAERWGARADGLLREAWRVRGFGAFWGMCLVAEGGVEVCLQAEPQSAWDVAALIPIVEEAGGRLTNEHGRTTLDRGPAITSNGVLHDEVLARLVPSSPEA